MKTLNATLCKDGYLVKVTESHIVRTIEDVKDIARYENLNSKEIIIHEN